MIDAEWVTLWDSFERPDAVKVFDELWVFFWGEAPPNLIVEWETEFEAGLAGTTTIATDQDTLSLFDTAKFDEDVFSLTGAQIHHTHLANAGCVPYGKFLQLKFKNNAKDAPFTIMAYIVKWHIDRDRNDAVDPATP